ncbi:EAL domain-containing response regulator [Aestuariispira insulae]|uniref:EAL domain-containing protein (Putative c-di-GMP-specific phosphodiesterase class I) n=1 Tax=Aestuariispira insulae TaxID=1461337 RepID=A0A3D9H5C0_9PROT|nr:EAL domain-containing response regulator [Aestuariispira insulae]RED44684.1 EAL domain-containing protein (putative c-di-GMP-specific phosphodiesterase class I) [Aestuariispira insulae]
MKQKRLIVLDDTVGMLDLIGGLAEDLGYQVRRVDEVSDFQAVYDEFQPNFITLDLAMPGGDGVEILRFLGQRGCQARIVIISGFDNKVVASAMRLGREFQLEMAGSLHKPFAISDLETLLEEAADEAGGLNADQLCRAIRQGEIQPFFQPKVRLDGHGDQAVLEAEALARWPGSEFGPADFIPRAEEEGLIGPLTFSMIEQVAARLADWRGGGLNLSIAVNISPALLTDLSFPDQIAELVRQHGAQPDWIVLEITESAAMEDASRAMDILTRLRLKGFSLSCDDFGTGYSSLVQLYRMPFVELKIDQSFVREADEHEEARAVIRASIELAHQLGLKVCAEGVEVAGILDFLIEAGCESVQGFYFSKPVPASDLADVIENLNNANATGQRATCRPH